MANKSTILIRNIYHMLSYAFQELRKNNYDNIAEEDFKQKVSGC
jgi:5-methylcytosine-specific restriction enzyme subunit McrC